MENMYYRYCGRLQQNINQQRKWAETFGPRKQDRVERSGRKIGQQRLKQFNLRGFFVQGQEERENEKHDIKTLALGKWPWDYPKYESTTLRRWEGTRKFHDLM
jgi:hypothetical protein